MLVPSHIPSPRPGVSQARSEPARSMKLSLATRGSPAGPPEGSQCFTWIWGQRELRWLHTGALGSVLSGQEPGNPEGREELGMLKG